MDTCYKCGATTEHLLIVPIPHKDGTYYRHLCMTCYQKAQASYKVGDHVVHLIYGVGRILLIVGDEVEIMFGAPPQNIMRVSRHLLAPLE